MVILVWLLIIAGVLAEECTPWGVRLSFGEFYSNTSETNQIYVAFNTDAECSLEAKVKVNNHLYNCTTEDLSITF